MEFRDYAEFTDGALILPYRGKQYTIPEIDIDMGIRLNGITNHGQEADLDSLELVKDLLGEDLFNEMRADRVPDKFLNRVFATIVADFQFGREYARAMWETGADPKAMAEYLKAQGNRASRRSKSTGGAKKTR